MKTIKQSLMRTLAVALAALALSLTPHAGAAVLNTVYGANVVNMFSGLGVTVTPLAGYDVTIHGLYPYVAKGFIGNALLQMAVWDKADVSTPMYLSPAFQISSTMQVQSAAADAAFSAPYLTLLDGHSYAIGYVPSGGSVLEERSALTFVSTPDPWLSTSGTGYSIDQSTYAFTANGGVPGLVINIDSVNPAGVPEPATLTLLGLGLGGLLLARRRR